MDYHTHHYRCGHAFCVIEDYIKEAINKGLSEIGISEHFPNLAAIEDSGKRALSRRVIGMPTEEFPEYLQEVKELREKYRGKIKVKISTEVAFGTPGKHFDRQKEFLSTYMDDFDYLLCGIHDIQFDSFDSVSLAPGNGREIFEEYSEEKIHAEYFKKMRSIVETGFFDIVTHFDNHRLLWLPDEPSYRADVWREVMDLLDLIKSNGMAVEINTMGIRKDCSSQFPTDNIVKELIRRDVPLTLSSDAHQPEHVGYGFKDFIAKARPWGLKYLCTYEKRKQTLIPI